MRTAHVPLLVLAATLTAHADFSYTMTQKSGPGDQTAKHYLKGQKMKMERGTKTTIMDFEAQTLTSIDNTTKTYTVMKFSDMANAAAGVEIKADIKKTGERKTINGYDATQVIMTMDVDMPQAKAAGMKPQMEIELWVSQDVPGKEELIAFYRKNASHFPSAAMGGGNPSMQKAMIKLQQQMAELDGAVVRQVIRMKSGGGAGGLNAAQSQQMSQARARLEAMAQQGGPSGAAAQQALARMGGMGGGSGSSLFEMTMEGGDFSSRPIPESAFAIPAGYQKSEK
jgi:hypothetical protein